LHHLILPCAHHRITFSPLDAVNLSAFAARPSSYASCYSWILYLPALLSLPLALSITLGWNALVVRSAAHAPSALSLSLLCSFAVSPHLALYKYKSPLQQEPVSCPLRLTARTDFKTTTEIHTAKFRDTAASPQLQGFKMVSEFATKIIEASTIIALQQAILWTVGVEELVTEDEPRSKPQILSTPQPVYGLFTSRDIIRDPCEDKYKHVQFSLQGDRVRRRPPTFPHEYPTNKSQRKPCGCYESRTIER